MLSILLPSLVNVNPLRHRDCLESARLNSRKRNPAKAGLHLDLDADQDVALGIRLQCKALNQVLGVGR
jgi:hypothetical protein